VVLIGARRPAMELASGATWRQADPEDPAAMRAALDGVDAVVEIAACTDVQEVLGVEPRLRRATLLRRARAVLEAAAASDVRHVVVVTSAMVFGALPDNPVPLPEDAPVRAALDDGLVGDLVEVERLVTEFAGRGGRTGGRVDGRTGGRAGGRAGGRVPGSTVCTVLRPAALVGPGVDTPSTRQFEAPRLLAVRGARTAWQFCHVQDLAAAALTCLESELGGVFSVGSPGWLKPAEVERLSGMRRVEVPLRLAFGTAERLHRVGVLAAPAEDLAYVVHPWVVGASRLLAAGWVPRYSNQDCLAVLLEEVHRHRTGVIRRPDRRDAALGAAGAAVALVGTAALVRQARRRRHGRGISGSTT